MVHDKHFGDEDNEVQFEIDHWWLKKKDSWHQNWELEVGNQVLRIDKDSEMRLIGWELKMEIKLSMICEDWGILIDEDIKFIV